MYNLSNITGFFHFYYITRCFLCIKRESHTKMYKYLLILLLILPNSALAIDYTAKKSDPPEWGEQDYERKCSRDDLRKIKRFDRKAKIKIEEYKAIEATALDVKTKKTAIKFSEEMEIATVFFESDKFKEMEEIYDRCNMEIPKPQSEKPFWIPLDKEN